MPIVQFFSSILLTHIIVLLIYLQWKITNSLTPLWSLHHRFYFPLEIYNGPMLRKRGERMVTKEEPSQETESKCFIFIFDGFLQLNHQSLDHFSLFQFKNVIRKPSFNHLTLFYVFSSPSQRWKRSKERERERAWKGRWLIKRVLHHRKGFFFLLLHLQNSYASRALFN